MMKSLIIIIIGATVSNDALAKIITPPVNISPLENIENKLDKMVLFLIIITIILLVEFFIKPLYQKLKKEI